MIMHSSILYNPVTLARWSFLPFCTAVNFCLCVCVCVLPFYWQLYSPRLLHLWRCMHNVTTTGVDDSSQLLHLWRCTHNVTTLNGDSSQLLHLWRCTQNVTTLNGDSNASRGSRGSSNRWRRKTSQRSMAIRCKMLTMPRTCKMLTMPRICAMLNGLLRLSPLLIFHAA